MEVAIKRINAGMAELAPEAVEEFQQEASRMQAIRHPNLVTFCKQLDVSPHSG